MARNSKWKRLKKCLAILTVSALLGSCMQIPVFAEMETGLSQNENSEKEFGETKAEKKEEVDAEYTEDQLSGRLSEENQLPEKDEEESDKEVVIEEEADNIQLEEMEDEGSLPQTREAADPEVMLEKLNEETGDFIIRIKGITLGAGENVIVPTWSAEKQKDLIWYTAVKDGDDFLVSSNLSAHGYNTGVYNIHVYRRAADGAMNFLCKTVMDATPHTESVTIDHTSDWKSLQISTSGLKTLGTERIVEFAVWSDVNGQDDLKWYPAVKEKQGVWSYTVPLSGHKGTGTYHIHTYVKTKADKPVCVNTAKYEVAGSSVEDISCASFKAEVTGATGFRLTASGISAPFPVDSLIVPTWSKPDQSDIVWYTALKSGDSYIVNSDISKHNNNIGTYQTHLYVKDPAGKMICIGKSSFKIDGYTFGEVKAELNAEQSVAHLSLTDLKIYEKIWEIRFAVWSKENGQDDLRWYSAKNNNGTWEYDLKVADHRSVGEFIVHCYLARTDGSCVYLGPTSFNVEKKESISKITITDIDENAGSFLVVIETDSSASDIRVAIWSKARQEDIHWYFAKRTGDGKFLVEMNTRNHNNNFGNYQVHAYSYKNEIPTLLGTTTANLKISNQISITDTTRESYKVVIRGAEYDGNPATAVVCPTWTMEGGQDDLVWYPAKKQADGSFEATIVRSNHAHDGICITDVYVKNAAGQQKFAGRLISPELLQSERAFDSEARAVMRKIIYAVETGGQVYGRQRYDAFTEAYTNSSGETAITIGAGQWFASEAKRLLTLIKEQYPATFVQYDTAGIAADLINADWKYYGTDGAGHKTILKGSEKAVAIQNIISSAGGIAVQDSLVDEQMVKYADQAKALGVTDLKARLFCANIQHLGGYNAMVRIINYCKNDGDALTMENLWTNMRQREAGSGNYVGSDLYATRHQKVMTWLDTYL